MPDITSCPSCEKKLRVPDDLMGKQVKCPGCANMFTARPAGAPTPKVEEPPPPPSRSDSVSSRSPSRRRDEEDEDDRPPSRRRRDDDYDDEPPSRRRRDDDDDDDRPRARRRRDDDDDDYDDRPRKKRARDYDDDDDDFVDARGQREGLQGVRMGLQFVAIGGWVAFGASVLSVLFAGIAILITGTMVNAAFAGGGFGGGGMQATGESLFVGAQIFRYLQLLLLVAAYGLQTVGMGLCMKTPAHRSGSARTLAITAFCCYVGGAVFMVVIQALTTVSPLIFFRMGPTPIYAGGLLFGLAGIAACVLWLIYLQSLGSQIRNRELASDAMKNLIAWLIFWPSMVVLTFVVICGIGLVFASTIRPGARPDSVGGPLIMMMIYYAIVLLVMGGLYFWYLTIVMKAKTAVEKQIGKLR